MSEMVQQGNQHAKAEMLDFLDYMGTCSIENAGSFPNSKDQALSVRFGKLLKHYKTGLEQSVFNEDDCRYLYKLLKQNEPERMSWLERQCLEPWKKEWEARKSRIHEDRLADEFAKTFEKRTDSSKGFDDFMKSGKLDSSVELDLSGVGGRGSDRGSSR